MGEHRQEIREAARCASAAAASGSSVGAQRFAFDGYEFEVAVRRLAFDDRRVTALGRKWHVVVRVSLEHARRVRLDASDGALSCKIAAVEAIVLLAMFADAPNTPGPFPADFDIWIDPVAPEDPVADHHKTTKAWRSAFYTIGPRALFVTPLKTERP